MASELDQFSMGSSNWRQTLRQNNTRTMMVIGLFLLIYAGVGMLVDMFMATATYPNATIEQLFYALATFQIFPIATVCLIVIAGVSLLVSYSMYDRLMLMGTDYHEVTPEHFNNLQEQQLYNVVEEMKVAAGLRYMPRVYIITADYMNAFASGYSEKSAMVAITTGLMQKLNRDELQAVMAHELSHIRHMDIKLTLTASLLANLSLMVIDMLFYSAILGRGDERSKSRNNLAMIIILLRYLLPLINVVLLLYLSRTRELMADAGCVELMRNNQPLATALLKINDDHVQNRERYTAAYGNTPHENVRREAYIYDPLEVGIKSLDSVTDIFSTHPSLETRLRALGFNKKS